MKAPNFDESRKQEVKRIMRGFWQLVKIGVLVPELDEQGQPRRRKGEIVYKLTDDPELRAKYPGLNSRN